MDSSLESHQASLAGPVLHDEPDARIYALEQQLAFATQEQRQWQWRVKTLERALLETLPLVANQSPTQVTTSTGAVNQQANVLAELDHHLLVVDKSKNHYLFVRGWAWSLDASVATVELFVGRSRWHRLDYGYERRDVQRHFSGAPDMAWSGFAAWIKLPGDYKTSQSLVLQVCDECGAWKRFEIKPQCRSDVGAPAGSLQSRWKSRWSRGIARIRQRQVEAELLNRAGRQIRKLDSLEPYSFIVTVGDQQPSAIRELYGSLKSQIYPAWELILVPLHKQSNQLSSEHWIGTTSDPRVHCYEGRPDSRTDRLNGAIRMAKGKFVGFLEGHERLLPDAIAWLALALENSNAAWIYADAAIVNARGKVVATEHKPDFSDLHLRARFFTKGLSLYRRDECLAMGGVRAGCADAEEYDVALRLSDCLPNERIQHVPELLVHLQSDVPRAVVHERELAVAEKSLLEAGIEARVQCHPQLPSVRQIELPPRQTPKVAIVIPTRNKARLVRRCLDSVRSTTAYPHYDIVVIDNQSTEPELFELLEENSGRRGFSSVKYDRPFNHSAMHNDVLSTLDAEFVALVNNDVSDFSPAWLEQLIGVMALDERIACVSPLLLYPDGRVQHAGITVGGQWVVGHLHGSTPGDAAGYDHRLHCLQDLSACTAACLLVRLSAFRDVGGFDEQDFPVDFNDVDLCLRWGASGYRCVYQPAVRAVHLECASRDVISSHSAILEKLRERIEALGFRDRYFNPHLVLRQGQPQERFVEYEARRRQLARLVERLDSNVQPTVHHAA